MDDDANGDDSVSTGASVAEMCLKIPPTDVMGIDKLEMLLSTNLKVKRDFESYCDALTPASRLHHPYHVVSPGEPAFDSPTTPRASGAVGGIRDFNSFVVNHLQNVFEGENELSKNLSKEEKIAVQKSIRIWVAAAVSQ